MSDTDPARPRTSEDQVTCDLCNESVTDAMAHLDTHLRGRLHDPVVDE